MSDEANVLKKTNKTILDSLEAGTHLHLLALFDISTMCSSARLFVLSDTLIARHPEECDLEISKDKSEPQI